MKSYKICPWKMTSGAYRVFDRASGKELGSVFKKERREHTMTNDHGLNYSIGQRTWVEWAYVSVDGGTKGKSATLENAACWLQVEMGLAA